MKDATLLEHSLQAMLRYGQYTNENRAVPDFRDGFKPVFRRIIWALANLPQGSHKSARLVGDVIGKYHPHGDLAVYDAMETLVHSPTPQLNGIGNWGTLIDNKAAYRYTNLLLSPYGKTFVNPDYLAVSDLVPTYDNKDKEPVVLPSLFPNLFFNGADGIGVAITTTIPSYTPKSVLIVMIRMLKGENLEIKDFVDGLEFKLPYGGETLNTKENRKALATFYKTGEGSVVHASDLKISKDKRTIFIDTFVPGVRLISLKEKEGKKRRPGAIDKIREIDGVEFAENATDSKGLRFEVRIKKFKQEESYDKCIQAIRDVVSASRQYRMVVTERIKVEHKVEVKLFTTTVPDLMKKWLKWRIELEAKCLDYRIKREKDNLAYTKLLIYAIDHLDIIMKSLRQDDPDAYLVKNMKITPEQAKQILDLKVRQLSKMDKEQLILKGKGQKTIIEELSEWRKKPSAKVKQDFQKLLERVS